MSTSSFLKGEDNSINLTLVVTTTHADIESRSTDY